MNHSPTPHRPHKDVPGEFEPGEPPVEPDEGPVPAHIPDDPEHDRVIDPGVEAALRERLVPGPGGKPPSRVN